MALTTAGPHDGGFVAMLYKPIGKGARSRKAEQHKRVYIRKFATRKSAKARAMKMYAATQVRKDRWKG